MICRILTQGTTHGRLRSINRVRVDKAERLQAEDDMCCTTLNVSLETVSRLVADATS